MSLAAPLGLEKSIVFPDGGVYPRTGDKCISNTRGKICVSSAQYESHLQKPCHAPGELWEARGVSQAGTGLAQGSAGSGTAQPGSGMASQPAPAPAPGQHPHPAPPGLSPQPGAPVASQAPWWLSGASDNGEQLFSCEPSAPRHCRRAQISQIHGSTTVETIGSTARHLESWEVDALSNTQDRKWKKITSASSSELPQKRRGLFQAALNIKEISLWCWISAHDQQKLLKIPYDRALNWKRYSNILQPAEKNILNIFQRIFSIFPRGRVAQAQHKSDIQAVI